MLSEQRKAQVYSIQRHTSARKTHTATKIQSVRIHKTLPTGNSHFVAVHNILKQLTAGADAQLPINVAIG